MPASEEIMLADAADRRRTWKWPWAGFRRIAIYLAIAVVVIVARDAGLQLRDAAWVRSQGSHFKGDIANGWRWGREATEIGLFEFYDIVDARTVNQPRAKNDYTPLRLTVMRTWAKWTLKTFPNARGWQDSYEFTWPLLNFNTDMEALSAVLVFLIIRVQRIRMDDADRPAGMTPREFRGVFAGMFGALLFWFNPAIVWNGHAWPQWDVWLIPFFLAAVLMASVGWWFVAGACIVVGAFFKGQMLIGAGVLLLWPLFAGQFAAALRLSCGFVFMGAVVASPWMRMTRDAYLWLGLLSVGMATLWPIRFGMKARWPWVVGMCVAAMLLAWPWSSREDWVLRPMGLVLVASTVYFRLIPTHWQLRGALYGLVIGLAVFATIPLYDASTTWYTMGFEFGAKKFESMITGSGSWNVPAMMLRYFSWSRDPRDLVKLPLMSEPIEVQTMFRASYAVTLLLCGVAAALQSRRRDTRFLAAVVAPWLCFFLLLTQMHGRYTIWAAGLSSLLAGVSVGMALLGVLVSVISMLGIMQNQFAVGGGANAETLQRLRSFDPHLGLVLILIALIYLYTALTPRRR